MLLVVVCRESGGRGGAVGRDDGNYPQGHHKGEQYAISMRFTVKSFPLMSLIKSQQRVTDHGEVFTPTWMVDAMLDLVKDESERIDSRFLEPACGSGNFLVRVLQRKLAAVERKYGKSDFERRHFALYALMSIYGIELLADNIAECRANLLDIFAEYLTIEASDDLYRAAVYVLSWNLVHGDALKMLASDGQPIVFAEWRDLGEGKFQRRDFRFDVLTGTTSKHVKQETLFVKQQSLTPTLKTYPPMTVNDLASSHLEAT
jgi:hypothetical protein